MKAILSVFPLAMLAALVACSAPDHPAADATAPPAQSPAAPASTPATEPAAPTPPPAPAAQDAGGAQAGWYMEHGATGMFQPCGQDVHLAVDSADLRQRARDFGLGEGTPVYVRLSGTTDGSNFTVARVDQFGSPEPVSDCPMTGTMTQ